LGHYPKRLAEQAALPHCAPREDQRRECESHQRQAAEDKQKHLALLQAVSIPIDEKGRKDFMMANAIKEARQGENKV